MRRRRPASRPADDGATRKPRVSAGMPAERGADPSAEASVLTAYGSWAAPSALPGEADAEASGPAGGGADGARDPVRGAASGSARSGAPGAAAASRRAAPPRTSLIALLAGVVVAALVLGAVLLVAWAQRREIQANAVERAALLARVLDDQAARSVDTAAVSLHALAASLARRADLDAAPAVQPVLEQALVGLPFVRSLALVDADGRVLASTQPGDAGHVTDPARLGLQAGNEQARLGGFLVGRSLVDIATPDTPPPVIARPPPRIGFIPLQRAVKRADGSTVWLVALLNPDSFATYQLLATGETGRLAVLAGYDGQVLASTSEAIAPGSRLTAHPVWQQWLARSEHGSYVGPGLGGPRQIVAFRASRTQPLVALVEEPQDAAVQRWWAAVRWFVVAGCAAAVGLLALSWAAWRSLRARESARRERDAEQARVVQNERQLRVLVKSLQELIFRTDAQGRLAFVNARWKAAAGRDAQDILGHALPDLVDPADAPAVRRLFAPDGPPGLRMARARLPSRDRTPRIFDFAVTPLRSNGQVVAYAGSAVDVTERWAAEQQLQAQLAFSALLLEISPLPMAMSDETGRLVTVNRAWAAFLGHRDARLANQADGPDAGADGNAERGGPRTAPTAGMVAASGIGGPGDGALNGPRQPHDEQQRHLQHDRRLLAPAGPVAGRAADEPPTEVRYEARVRHADGSLRDVVVTKVRVPGEGGRARGILCALMDVSEFREAERATRDARDAAEEASRAKSEFIANISHELRTPLQSILGFSELGMVRGADAPKLAAMFRDIHASGERMLALVNDLLDVAKIESTVGTFHLERTDLRGLVRAVVRELDPLLARKRLRIELDLSEAPLVAKVDPLRFQQVMRNILANAIKFSPPERPIELSGHAWPQGELRLAVRDHGPGIPPAELDQIFEAFVQSSTTKDGSGGTGLGLAICRKIVEAHGGRITATNAPGGGAVFELVLPARGYAETAPMTLA